MTPPEQTAQGDLFARARPVVGGGAALELEPGAVVLRAYAADDAPALLDAIERIAQAAPLRHMVTARGWRMSVAMTNCGAAGWLSDHSGYRCGAVDPQTGQPWPAMPEGFASLATRADRPRRVVLNHGDTVVWGGPARLNFHGIDTLRESQHALTGSARFNLTFRRAM